MDEIKKFQHRQIMGPRSVMLEVRVHPEQKAAYMEAAKIEGDGDVSSWTRRMLDKAARSALKKK